MGLTYETSLYRAPRLVCCLLASQTLKAYLAEAQGAWSAAQASPQKAHKKTAETSRIPKAHETRLQHLEQDLIDVLCA